MASKHQVTIHSERRRSSFGPVEGYLGRQSDGVICAGYCVLVLEAHWQQAITSSRASLATLTGTSLQKTSRTLALLMSSKALTESVSFLGRLCHAFEDPSENEAYGE